ncbi:MAG: DUF1802 family protein [Chloroflexi bacterium]|nr:DUF1802 family protein [Chloroflexota bacterium]
MFPASCGLALKEWAVTLRALDQGEQVLLLRKGGIREPGKEFRVLYPEFLLYPTFEHQREELVQPRWRPALRETVAQGESKEHVTFTHFARLHEVIEVSDQEKVDALAPCYLWTTDYAEKRLHWKPRKPLAVVLTRVYRMAEPKTVPILSEYSGCTSWVTLAQQVPIGALIPVLGEVEFLRQVEAVHRTLGLVPTST